MPPKSTFPPRGPNVLVTGTPGTGKTSLCAILARELGLGHIGVGAFARERELVHGYDAEMDCHFLHEDAVLDALEPIMSDGGILLDHHSVDWFPERWIHCVIVLRTSTETLHDRLSARKYSDKKRDENMQAEIMQVVLDEARESYPKVPLLELMSDTLEQQQSNVAQIKRQLRELVSPN